MARATSSQERLASVPIANSTATYLPAPIQVISVASAAGATVRHGGRTRKVVTGASRAKRAPRQLESEEARHKLFTRVSVDTRLKVHRSADGSYYSCTIAARHLMYRQTGCTIRTQKGGLCTRHGHGAEHALTRASDTAGTVEESRGCVYMLHYNHLGVGTLVHLWSVMFAVLGVVICSHDGYTNTSQSGGLCIKHKSKMKRWSHDECTNYSHSWGYTLGMGQTNSVRKDVPTEPKVWGVVCVHHRAKVITCRYDGCTNPYVQGGVCWKHGAKIICHHDGYDNIAKEGRVCNKQWSKVKTCIYDGCAKNVKKRRSLLEAWVEVGEDQTCSQEGCTNQGQSRSVCNKYGTKKAKGSCCRHYACTNFAQKEGSASSLGKVDGTAEGGY